MGWIIRRLSSVISVFRSGGFPLAVHLFARKAMSDEDDDSGRGAKRKARMGLRRGPGAYLLAWKCGACGHRL